MNEDYNGYNEQNITDYSDQMPYTEIGTNLNEYPTTDGGNENNEQFNGENNLNDNVVPNEEDPDNPDIEIQTIEEEPLDTDLVNNNSSPNNDNDITELPISNNARQPKYFNIQPIPLGNNYNKTEYNTVLIDNNTSANNDESLNNNNPVYNETTIINNSPDYNVTTINDNTPVYNESTINDNTPVYNEATINNNTPVYNESTINNNTPVYNETTINNNTRAYNAATINNTRNYNNAVTINNNNKPVYNVSSINNNTPVYNVASINNNSPLYNPSSINNNVMPRKILLARQNYNTNKIAVNNVFKPRASIAVPLNSIIITPYQYQYNNQFNNNIRNRIYPSVTTSTTRYNASNFRVQPFKNPLLYPNTNRLGVTSNYSLLGSYNQLIDYSTMYGKRTYRARALSVGRRNY